MGHHHHTNQIKAKDKVMYPKVSMYKDNKKGPKTEPCGTPYLTFAYVLESMCFKVPLKIAEKLKCIFLHLQVHWSGIKGDIRALPRLQCTHAEHGSLSESGGGFGMPILY